MRRGGKVGRDEEEEKGRGKGEISLGIVYSQDPRFLEWCTEIARLSVPEAENGWH